MKYKLYIDTVSNKPLLAIEEETLSNGSKVFNLKFTGFDAIHCINEKKAFVAFTEIASTIKQVTNENVVVF